MKLNNWTVGLAAIGVISLASAARAEEEMNPVQTLASGTTISGYVSTSFEYNFNTANNFTPLYGLQTDKANGINLDVVKLTIEKPLDETEWAAGYSFSAMFGPDANWLNTAAAGITAQDFAIREAYVALRTPVGNGIDWKMGVWDTIIGYESFDGPANPNYTRSYGWSIEPTTHTGLLGSYQATEMVGIAFGVAETYGPTINQRPSVNSGTGAGLVNPSAPEGNNSAGQFDLTYIGAVSITLPEETGALEGSTLYGGALYGRVRAGGNNVTAQLIPPGALNNVGNNVAQYYAGMTLGTPIAGFRVGAAFDYVDTQSSVSTLGLPVAGAYAWAGSLYTSFQATEKLSLHGRGEYYRGSPNASIATGDANRSEIWAGTVTAQYDLWENVISRLEVRWDSANEPIFGDSGQSAGGGSYLYNSWMVALNVVYQF